MPPTQPEPRCPWLIRGAGVGAVVLFLWLVARFWHPVYGFTSFLMMDHSLVPPKIEAVREQPVYIYPYLGDYDGMYYAQIAHHPLLDSRELGPAMDDLPYRARRILPSAMAWLLAGGRPFWIFDAYSALNILAWLALAWILWRLIDVRDARTWIAWAGVMFSAGAMISVRRALTDLVALAFIAGFLLLQKKGRRLGPALALGAAALCRETSLLAAAGLRFGGRRRTGAESQPTSPTWATSLAIAAVPLAAWLAYVRIVAGPGIAGIRNFTWPLAGFLGKWSETLSDSGAFSDPLVASAASLALLGLTVQALYLCIHRDTRDPWWRIGAAYLLMMAVLGPAVWQGTPSAAYRVLLPMTLAFNLVAAGRRSPFLWILIGNLTVVQGLVSFRDLPERDKFEINAVRSLTSAGIIREGPGWFGPEHSPRHDWWWTPGRGRLSLEVWPRDRAHMTLHVSLLSVVIRKATIAQDGAKIWSGTIGPVSTPVTVVADVRDGRAELDFFSDTAPVHGGSGGEFRHLTLAVYDPRLVLGSTEKPQP
jgi:Glycosyltransferase family 87